MNRFSAGDHGEIGGIRWQVRAGTKGPTDLVLELKGASGFRPAKMSLGFLMADFYGRNEEELYPSRYGFEGGGMYMRFCRTAQQHGWITAAVELEEMRQRARRRRDVA